jgi:hypothetical protein
MSRLSSASKSTDFGVALPDFDPLHAGLNELTLEEGNFGTQLKLVWRLTDEKFGDQWVWDYVSLKLGKNNSGQASKLRKLLNALMGQPEVGEVWFDDVSFEYGIGEDGPVSGMLKLGETEVILRGQNQPDKNDPTATRFRVTTYQSAGAKTEKPAAAPATAAAAADF